MKKSLQVRIESLGSPLRKQGIEELNSFVVLCSGKAPVKSHQWIYHQQTTQTTGAASPWLVIGHADLSSMFFSPFWVENNVERVVVAGPIVMGSEPKSDGEKVLEADSEEENCNQSYFVWGEELVLHVYVHVYADVYVYIYIWIYTMYIYIYTQLYAHICKLV